jgi:4-hydroxybenzoate polyprenyltransferase
VITFFAYTRLTRFKELTCFVLVTSLLGAASGNAKFGWTLLGVLLANWLAVTFAFMINDVEDAPDDALDPKKVKRNPVSAGDLSPRQATLASFGVGLVSAALFFTLGFWPCVLGLLSLFLGFIYSWRRIRLKNMAFLDLASHCLMLAGLQFLSAFTAFDPHQPLARWLIPLIFVVSISLYGELFNELRDLDGDKQAGLRHTAVLLGARPAYWLMMALLVTGAGCGAVTIFVLEIIPGWVLLMLLGTGLVFAVMPLLRIRRQASHLALQHSFQKPLEYAGALSLGTQFAGPWVWQILSVLVKNLAH